MGHANEAAGPVQFRYLVRTFGCQMNVHDSDRMEGVLRAAGGVAVAEAEQADLVVFNTCSVREKAEQKLRSEAGKLKHLAGVESGMDAFVNDVAPEEAARRLREVAS